MISTYFLSIVIPVYNASKVIKRCLESIWSQGLLDDEYEVICVDDCSTDDGCNIIEKEMLSHLNLKLIRNDENHRAGGARNQGVKVARGNYILFIDSDDYFHENSIKRVLNELKKQSVDILVCQYIRELEDKRIETPLHIYDGDEIFSPEEYRMHHGFIPYSPWQWIFKRDIMLKNNIWFEENVCAEDVDWTHRLAHEAKTIRCVPVILLHYVLTRNSQTAIAAHTAKTAYHALMAAKRLLTLERMWQCPDNRKYIRNVAASYATAGIKSYLFFGDKVKNKKMKLMCYLCDDIPLRYPWRIAVNYPFIYSLITDLLHPLAIEIYKFRAKFKYRGVKL